MKLLSLFILAQTMNLNDGTTRVRLPPSQSGAFGEVLTVEAEPVLHVSFPYNVVSQEYVITATDAGSVTADGGHAILTVGTTGYSEMRTRLASRYIPGQGMAARFTFVASRPCTAGVEMLIGAGDDDDQFAFGCCPTCEADGGTAFATLRRTQGVSYWTPASAWNGAWGRTPPNITYGRPYQVQWQWLGYGQITYSIEDATSGSFVVAHSIKYAGTATETSIANPTLPLHAHLIASGGDGGFVMRIPSMGMYRQGAEPNGGLRRSASGSTAMSTTEKAVLSVRDDSTYNGRTNRTQLNPQLLSYSASTPAGADITVRLRWNPNTTGASFTPINATASCASTDVAGTLASDGGFFSAGVEWLSFVVAGGSDGFIDLHPYNLHMAPGDVLVVTGQASSGTPTLRTSLSWVEDY